jgi:hypothetical protein
MVRDTLVSGRAAPCAARRGQIRKGCTDTASLPPGRYDEVCAHEANCRNKPIIDQNPITPSKGRFVYGTVRLLNKLLMLSSLRKFRLGLLLACFTKFATLAAIMWLHKGNSRVQQRQSETRRKFVKVSSRHKCIREYSHLYTGLPTAATPRQIHAPC